VDPVRTGFTRPGSPSDSLVGGKVVTALDDPQARKKAFGGTVYYMVLERTGKDGAGWGVGLKDFEARFRAGIDFNGSPSPALDTSAKYLYLYEVVNDRRTPVPIQSASLKLHADAKEITSWGYFHGVGLATPPAAAKAGPIRPVSVANVVGAETERLYRREAPAVAVPAPFRVVQVPTRRGEKEPVEKDQKVVNVLWDALDPATDPDYVMLLSGSDSDQRPTFRAIWNGKNVLAREARSTVFGYTSNLPPKLEDVRLRGELLDDKGNPIRPAAGEVMYFTGSGEPSNARGGQVFADGRAPTAWSELEEQRKSPPSTTPRISPPAPGGGGGGAPTTAGGGSPFSGAAPVGAIGSSAAPFVGGGGTGSGSGSSPSPAVTAASTGQAQSSGQPAQTQTILINPTFLNQDSNQNTGQNINQNTNQNTNQNQQSQQQQQGQAQQQSQRQSQQQRQTQDPASGHQGCPCEAVPAPAALLLGVLGLPFLLLLRRKNSPGTNATLPGA
jgi:hypothetical protein